MVFAVAESWEFGCGAAAFLARVVTFQMTQLYGDVVVGSWLIRVFRFKTILTSKNHN